MSRLVALLFAAAMVGCAGPGARPMMLHSDGGGYSINVRDFGAVPNDLADDTVAIQRALIAARGNYFNGRAASGSTVFLPAGEYDVEGLDIFTGTTLRGEGQGSFIKCSTTRPAVTVKTHFGHGGVAFVAIENLSIAAPQGSCIASNAACNSRFEHLALSSKDVCMQFDGYNQSCVFHDICIAQTGSGALRIAGNANRIDRIDTEGGPAPNYDFVPAKAMIEIDGDGNEISGCIIEGGYHGVAVAIKGGLNHYRNNWIEFNCQPERVALLLEDAWMCDFDRLPAAPDAVVRMRNCRGVRVGDLWLTGDRIRDGFDLDEQTAGVEIDTVNCAFDCGGMDDSQIHALRFFSRRGKMLIPNPPFRTGDNWAATLTRENNPWLAQWTDGTAVPTSIEPKPDRSGYRLKIDIAEKKSDAFRVLVPVNVPEEFIGSTPFACWRADAPAGQNMIVYCQGMDSEFFTRSTGSLTATKFPRPIKAGGEIAMYFHHAKPGTYYISDVRVGR